MDIVYLDNAATTKVSDKVREAMEQAEQEFYYNSAALYAGSLAVKKKIDLATETVLKQLTRSSDGTLVFTSGATESNNIVIFGKVTSARHHLLVVSGEHSSVYAPSVFLKNNGFEVDYVPLSPTGEIDVMALKRLVRPSTALFVFGMVNSDTGTLQNVHELVKAVREVNPRTHIHCDAVQGFCKYSFDVGIMGLDSVAVSSHKINGPKGIGALWLRKGVSLKPIMLGGGQQDYRPGTENNSAVLGFAKAVETFDTVSNYNKVLALHRQLIKGLPKGCTINGTNANPYITNIQLPGVLGQTVMNALSAQGIYVGLGSACASTASKNRTLLAMGVSEERTKQVLRVSLGVNNSKEDIETFLIEFKKILNTLT